jgi:hypothetical protein
LTTAEYPRFFWFTPENNAEHVEFTLYNTDENLLEQDLVYETTFQASGQPGIVSLKLPDSLNIPPLEVNQVYRWAVSLVCNVSQQRVISASGWIQRVEPDMKVTQALKEADRFQQVDILAANGFWFDTLETLTELRCNDPKNSSFLASWKSVLTDSEIALNNIADQPILSTCSAPQSFFQPDNSGQR